MLNLMASARSFGSNNRAIKNVEITLTVIVLSIPSTSWYFGVASPAFSVTISKRSSFCARLQNCLTLSYELRSTCHTSTTPVRFVLSSMSFFAASPFSTLRQPMITFEAPSRTKCRVASSPRPTFAPVTMIVLPLKSVSGYGRVVNWETRNEPTKSEGLADGQWKLHTD